MITFIVEGQGKFPVDMLRYDCAFPASTASAYAILEDHRREITLVSDRHRLTPERWQSFGWIITAVNGERSYP